MLFKKIIQFFTKKKTNYYSAVGGEELPEEMVMPNDIDSSGSEVSSSQLTSFQDFVDDLLERTFCRVERDMPEFGDFIPIQEFFLNPDPDTRDVVGKYGIKIYKMKYEIEPDPKKRYVECEAYVPDASYKADILIASGYKDEILATLKDNNFHEKYNSTCGRLLEMLMDF